MASTITYISYIENEQRSQEEVHETVMTRPHHRLGGYRSGMKN